MGLRSRVLITDIIGAMALPKLSFIIATRNRKQDLMRCLESIERQSYPDRELIVVDDGSTDASLEAVAERFPRARLLRHETRAGVGAALTDGARAATGDVWVHLDDDCYLVDDDAASLIAAYLDDRPDISVLCFRVEAPDGSVRHREIPLRSKRLPTVDTQIGYFLGGAVALRGADLQSVGGYPVSIGYGSWENDVAFRMWSRGFRTLFVPSIRVVHSAVPSTQNTRLREANYVQTEISVAAAYLPTPYAQVHAVSWTGNQLIHALGKGHASVTVKAAVAAFRRWPSLRRDDTWRLTLAQTRSLSAVSGRTWY
jgi:GT2 family glycosyltransferase